MHCMERMALRNLQGIRFVIFYCLIWVVCVETAGFQEEPSSSEVTIGSSVTLRCIVSGNLEVVSVYWWNINASRAVSDGTRIVPRYLSQDQVKRFSISGDSSAGEFHLHISNASSIDSATYSCRIWDGTIWHFSRQVSLDVVRGSPECTMQASLPVDVGDNVRLWCRSYSTDPSVQLHWLSKGRLFPSIPNLSTRTTSVIQHVLTEHDYDVPFLCLEATADERKWCQIVPLHRQISVIVQDPVTTVYAGEAAAFQCNTGISKDTLTFQWLVNGVHVEETRDYIRLQVDIADNGTRLTCRVQDVVSGLSGENDATLFVLPRLQTTSRLTNTTQVLQLNHWFANSTASAHTDSKNTTNILVTSQPGQPFLKITSDFATQSEFVEISTSSPITFGNQQPIDSGIRLTEAQFYSLVVCVCFLGIVTATLIILLISLHLKYPCKTTSQSSQKRKEPLPALPDARPNTRPETRPDNGEYHEYNELPCMEIQTQPQAEGDRDHRILPYESGPLNNSKPEEDGEILQGYWSTVPATPSEPQDPEKEEYINSKVVEQRKQRMPQND